MSSSKRPPVAGRETRAIDTVGQKDDTLVWVLLLNPHRFGLADADNGRCILQHAV